MVKNILILHIIVIMTELILTQNQIFLGKAKLNFFNLKINSKKQFNGN